MILDSHTAEAAYSLRQIRTAYAGSCIRVRRSSDNTEQDIGFSAGVLDTASLLTFCGAGSGYVKTWYDQSGNARDVTQATTANQLRIVNAGVVDTDGGLPGLRQTTGSAYLQSGSLSTISQPIEAYIVAKEAVGSGQRRILAGQVYLWGATGGTNWAINAGASLTTATRDTARHLFTVLYNGATSLIRIDGLSEVTGNAGTTGLGQFAFFADIGGGSVAGSGSFIQEAIFFSSNKSASRASIESDINGYWSIYEEVGELTLTLPSALSITLDLGDSLGYATEDAVTPLRPTISVSAITDNTVTLSGSAYTEPDPYLLDDYTGAAAAFSLRHLRSAYTAYALRVRRSSDNAETDVSFDGTGVVSLDSLVSAGGSLGTWVGVNSAYVVTWYDQSGNARNVTQATAANQPRLVSAGALETAGGMVAVRALGTSRLVSGAIGTIAQPVEVYMIAKETLGTGSRRLLAGGVFVYGDGSNWLLYGGTALTKTGRDTNSHLFTALANGASSLLRVDGVEVTGNAGTNGLTQFALFALTDGTTAAGNGSTMRELVIYPANKSTDRAAIEANLAAFHGITLP